MTLTTLARVAVIALLLPANTGCAIAQPSVLQPSVPQTSPLAPGCGRVDERPGATWSEPDPAGAGWDTARLGEAHALFESLDSAAVVVVHRGRPIAMWGDVAEPYTTQSLRKALLNSLLGQLVDEGQLSTDATLESLQIDDTNPALTPAERQATVEDLMRARSGISHTALYEVGSNKRYRTALEARKLASGPIAPGALWFYNNWDFNALGTIVEQVAGEEIGPLFARRVAAPLMMQDFVPSHVEYTTKESETERMFSNWSEHRAYVFNMSTRDLARYGLLYLGCGAWDERQVVSRDWVERSVVGVQTGLGRSAEEQDTGFGDWGYLWQAERAGSRRLTGLHTREPVYMGTGFRGHYVWVAPYLDLVIVHQVATVGGVSLEAQIRRATQGTPEVEEEDLERLFAAIIAAHPEGATAFEPEA